MNHGLSLLEPQSDVFDVKHMNPERKSAIIREAKTIMEKVSRVRYEMGRDYPMPEIEDDGEPLVREYNLELKRLAGEGKGTWFTCPWLFAECYLYRLLRSFFKLTDHWAAFDQFAAQKDDTFMKSSVAVAQIATTMHGMESTKDILESDPSKLEVLFREMLQVCLWGNATDLSLLTHMTIADIENLQSVGKEAQTARQEYILKDDQQAVWDHVRTLKNARIDIVLDNAGFELFTDLIFADFLVTYTPYVSKVVFHPKAIPWFVSDVLPTDFLKTIRELIRSPSFSSPSSTSPTSKHSAGHLKLLANRWDRYLSDGTFALSVPLETPIGAPDAAPIHFWTSPWPYWDLRERDEELFGCLEGSGLVVFKGDLNYRKLTGDIRWPVSTPFATAVGPLAGAFPILSLRTNKADVAVGVDEAVVEKLEENWRISGKYALISFIPKADA